MNARNLFRPPPPPPGSPASAQLTRREEPQPEELTLLADEDMEMWAVSGTRILTKPTPMPAPVAQAPGALEATLGSQPAWQQTLPSFHSSYPPVAISPSEPPPAVVMVQPSAPSRAYSAPPPAMQPRPKTNTLGWIALIVGASLLGLATTATMLLAMLYDAG